MKQETISLKCYKDNEAVFVEVLGHQKGGLAVHKHFKENVYNLTHLATGIVMNSHKMNRKQAVQWLEESAELIDWTVEDIYRKENIAKLHEIPLIAMRIRGEQCQNS